MTSPPSSRRSAGLRQGALGRSSPASLGDASCGCNASGASWHKVAPGSLRSPRRRRMQDSRRAGTRGASVMLREILVACGLTLACHAIDYGLPRVNGESMANAPAIASAIGRTDSVSRTLQRRLWRGTPLRGGRCRPALRRRWLKPPSAPSPSPRSPPDQPEPRSERPMFSFIPQAKSSRSSSIPSPKTTPPSSISETISSWPPRLIALSVRWLGTLGNGSRTKRASAHEIEASQPTVRRTTGEVTELVGIAGRWPCPRRVCVDDLLRLLDLEPLEVNLFRGQSRDLAGRWSSEARSSARRWSPRVGLVEGRWPHSLHAYFLRPGDMACPHRRPGGPGARRGRASPPGGCRPSRAARCS